MSDTVQPTMPLDELRDAVQWVLGDISEDGLPPPHRMTLTRRANREDFFATILPELDYEIRGGTWEEPLWAFTQHPWFHQLRLTREECEDYLRGPSG